MSRILHHCPQLSCNHENTCAWSKEKYKRKDFYETQVHRHNLKAAVNEDDCGDTWKYTAGSKADESTMSADTKDAYNFKK